MKIWQEPITVDDMNQRAEGTAAQFIGIRFLEVGDDFVKASMPVDHRTRQPLGLLNGGASCLLAETIASTAANYCVSQKEAYCVGLDINANHVRSATEGEVIATTRPIHLGKRTQVWHVELHDQQDKLICVARMTMAVIAR